MKTMKFLLLTNLLFFMCSQPNGQSVRLEARTQSDNWVKTDCQGIKLTLALNSESKTPPLRRKIFLLLMGADFTTERLKQIFSCFASQHPFPMSLSISAYSSKKMLRKAIKVSQLGHSIDFVDTEEGRKARDEYYKRLYPSRTGYWNAFYYRDSEYEGFRYTPDPAKEEQIVITMKDKRASPK